MTPAQIEKQQRLEIWLKAEQRLATSCNPEDLRTSGLISTEMGNWNNALLRLEEALQWGVRDFQTLDAFGESTYRTGQYALLLPFQEYFLNPTVSVHLARAHWMLGDRKQAAEICRISQPGLLKSAIERMATLPQDIDSALEHFLCPLDTDREPLSFVEYWQLLAPLAEVAGRRDLVLQAERRLKALASDRPVIHFNQSLRFLNDLEFSPAWKMYESRLIPGSACPQPLSFGGLPMWEGQYLKAHQTLLLVLENGWGDQIFSLRFVSEWIRQKEGQVELVVQAPLFELAQQSFPNLVVHRHEEAFHTTYWSTLRSSGKTVPHAFCYALSLPARAYWGDVKQTTGYLQISAERLKKANEQLAKLNPRGLPIVSLTWHGDIRTAPMRTRAYSVQEMAEVTDLFKTPCFILCLQKDRTTQELFWLQEQAELKGCIVLDVANELTDFAKTAEFLMCSSQIFSCDTAVAHLAGALGCRGTVYIRNTSIWHWKTDQKGHSIWNQSLNVQEALTPRHSYMFDL